MICPRCGARYPRGFSECTHCEVRLVPEAGEAVAGAAAAAGGARHCPECGAEYRPEVAECADCAVALVAGAAQAPPEPDHPEPDLVTVTEISEPNLLPVVVGLLRASGIEPVVEGEEIMGLWPVGRPAAGWTDTGLGLSASVRVARDRAEEARALLAEVEERAAETDGE